jgi:hypothetical protein
MPALAATGFKAATGVRGRWSGEGGVCFSAAAWLEHHLEHLTVPTAAHVDRVGVRSNETLCLARVPQLRRVSAGMGAGFPCSERF